MKISIDIPEGEFCLGCPVVEFAKAWICPIFNYYLWRNEGEGKRMKCPACLAACKEEKCQR